MDPTRNRQDRRIKEQPAVHADWHYGLRTAAWDALWQRILVDVMPQIAERPGASTSRSGSQSAGQYVQADTGTSETSLTRESTSETLVGPSVAAEEAGHDAAQLPD